MSTSTSSASQGKSQSIDLYRPLPAFKNARVKITSASPFVPTYIQSHVTQSSDPNAIYANRIRGRQILLENPARASRAAKERDENRKRRQAARAKKALGGMGRREAVEKGVWKLEDGMAKFDLFLPIHHLWLGYMSELLALPSPSDIVLKPGEPVVGAAGMHAKLVKADFHGSIMTVRQSKNPCLVGLSGIVIHETENAFKIVTKMHQLKLIPKQNSIFAFAVPLHSSLPAPSSSSASTSTTSVAPNSQGLSATSTVLDHPHIEFDLYGNQFRFRSAERAGRKFKHKETIEL